MAALKAVSTVGFSGGSESFTSLLLTPTGSPSQILKVGVGGGADFLVINASFSGIGRVVFASGATFGDGISGTYGQFSTGVALGLATNADLSSSTVFQAETDATTYVRIKSHATNQYSILSLSHSRGSKASPTVLADGDVIGYMSFEGYKTSGYAEGAAYQVLAKGAWATNYGTLHRWYAVNSGTDSLAEKMRLEDGSLMVGTATYNSSYLLNVNGAANFAGALTVDPGATGLVATLGNTKKLYVYDGSTYIALMDATAAGGRGIYMNATSTVLTYSTGVAGLALDGSGNVAIPTGKLIVTASLNDLVGGFVNNDATNGYGLAVRSEGTAASHYNQQWTNIDGTTVYGAISTATGQVGYWAIGGSVSGTLANRLWVNGRVSIGSGYDNTAAPTDGLLVKGNCSFIGSVLVGTSVTTGAPSGGTAGAWKFGIRVAAASVLDTTQYIQLDVGGTLYKLAVAA